MRNFYRLASWAGLLSGLFLTVDGFIDLFAPENTALAVFGPLSPVLGVFATTGMYLYLSQLRESRLLHIAFVLNVLGLIAIFAVSFSLNFVLVNLEEATVTSLLMSSPTFPAFLLARILVSLGIISFGVALLRHDYDRLGGWLYTLALPLSGIGALLPPAIGVVVAIVAGITISRLALTLRSSAIPKPV